MIPAARLGLEARSEAVTHLVTGSGGLVVAGYLETESGGDSLIETPERLACFGLQPFGAAR
jgi:hypothetical protein